MSLSHLSLEQLNQAVSLLKERETIQSQLAKIDDEIREIESGTPSGRKIKSDPKSLPTSDGVRKRTRRRKNVEQAVLKALQKAGAAGLNAKELAFRAKVKVTSLRTWLYTKGKTVTAIAHKGGGIFAYKAS